MRRREYEDLAVAKKVALPSLPATLIKRLAANDEAPVEITQPKSYESRTDVDGVAYLFGEKALAAALSPEDEVNAATVVIVSFPLPMVLINASVDDAIKRWTRSGTSACAPPCA
jgi:hypothetical protein